MQASVRRAGARPSRAPCSTQYQERVQLFAHKLASPAHAAAQAAKRSVVMVAVMKPVTHGPAPWQRAVRGIVACAAASGGANADAGDARRAQLEAMFMQFVEATQDAFIKDVLLAYKDALLEKGVVNPTTVRAMPSDRLMDGCGLLEGEAAALKMLYPGPTADPLEAEPSAGVLTDITLFTPWGSTGRYMGRTKKATTREELAELIRPYGSEYVTVVDEQPPHVYQANSLPLQAIEHIEDVELHDGMKLAVVVARL